MIKRQLLTILSIFIILNLTNFSYISGSFNDKHHITSKNETITDFSDFTTIEDSIYIFSNVNSTAIQMTANYDSEILSEWEKYQLLLPSGVSVSNFQLDIELYYSYSGTMLKRINIEAGSLHDENGNIADTNIICSASIWDAWDASEGVFAARAYGEDDATYEDGTIESQDWISIHMKRTNAKLSITIEQNGISALSKSWNTVEGLTRNLDFINLGLNINPHYTHNTVVAFTSLVLQLNSNLIYLTPLEIAAISIGAILLIGGIIGGAIYFSKKKKKTTVKQSIETDARQLLFFTNTKTDTTKKQDTSEINSNSQTYSWQIEEKEQ